MTQTAMVNYHVHRAERQAFHIDAGGVVGRLISPELVETPIDLRDVRNTDLSLSYEADGVGFVHSPTKVGTFGDSDNWKPDYERELVELLTQELAAKDVVIFDHTLRIDDPASDRKPARNVHSDYSPEGAQKRLRDILGSDLADIWSKDHFAFINVWRPVENPINSAPLGFVRPSSVKGEDWILIDLVYPDRRGHIMGLAANKDHEWIYQSRMTPDEVVYFNIYDNRGHPSVGHSAVDMVEDPTLRTIRKSLESRTLVRF